MTQKLDEEQIAEATEVCNLIGPHLAQAIAEGTRPSHETFERELWCKVYAASVSHEPERASTYHATVGDIAVERYNERFPK